MRGLQGRIEASRAGQVVISLVLILLVGSVAISTGQQSAIQREVSEKAGPVLTAVGLDQGWGVFAPDPRPVSFEFFARVTHDDGTTETWNLPHGSPFLSEYWDYRWRKYMEWLVQDPWADVTRRNMSAFIARELDDDKRTPKRVVLVRRWRQVRPPGRQPRQSPTREQAYYVYKVRPEDLRS